MQRLRRRGRPKAPDIPLSLDTSDPQKVACVYNTMARISAATADINRKDEEGSLCLPDNTLDRVSTLSQSLWEEFRLLPGSAILPLQESLTIYELILVDIQQILISDDPGPLQMSDVTINRRLDEFTLQFQEALGRLKGNSASLERGSPYSTHFFQNSHHIIISGGTFTSSNPVIHDPVVREQSRKILQVVYVQCGFLFAYSCHF